MTETGYDAFYLFFQLDRVGCLILILVYFKEKSQKTSTKLQINFNDQYSMTKTGL